VWRLNPGGAILLSLSALAMLSAAAIRLGFLNPAAAAS
jgi:hypothetical protein